MSDRPKNYTTTIPARQTARECADLLAEAGADHVAVSYENKEPVGIGFVLDTPHGPRSFKLPVNVAGVRKMLERTDLGSRSSPAWRSHEHAARVAWRVMRDWLDASLARIAADQAAIDEIMLPYLQIGGGTTVLERFREADGLLALEDGR